MRIKMVHQYCILRVNTKRKTIEIDARTRPTRSRDRFFRFTKKRVRNTMPRNSMNRGQMRAIWFQEVKLKYKARPLKHTRYSPAARYRFPVVLLLINIVR